MNRFHKHKSVVKSGDVHVLGACLRVHGRRPMRLRLGCAGALRRALRRLACMESRGDEPLRRFKMDAGLMEACLCRAQAEAGVRLPASGGSARVLLFARALLAGGERSISEAEMMKEITGFDNAQALEMREIQAMPTALNMALCEALSELADEILRGTQMRRAAEKWVRRGGRIPANCSGIFLEHALRLSAERELPALQAQLARIIEMRGEKREYIVEHVHRRSADLCLRLENLMHVHRMMDALDWMKCFEALSPADTDLREDPAGIYGRMDAQSRVDLRDAVEEMAGLARISELDAVRYALRLARTAWKRDVHDLRANVCWYFWADEGRRELARELGLRRRPKLRIPDASGRKTVILAASAAAIVMLAILWAAGSIFLAPYAPPLAWMVSQSLIARQYPRWVRPARLLKLEVERVPDSARTLVVLPVLLSSVGRVREMIANMEALGCLEQDANIDYLLLGDFRDGDSADLPEDEEILCAARTGIARLNKACGHEKYFYLHRGRSYRAVDGRWMGENRKRGALMALNRLLLDAAGAAHAFTAESGAAEKLAGRYRFVVTLDADTRYLPGTLQKLIGTMLHPLNRVCGNGRRGYAVLQPSMQMAAQACTNAYVDLIAGSGGVDSYPVTISEFYQDMTGRGCFAGKGVYDVHAFAQATDGVLRDDEILSHDLIEGILAGAGSLGDVCFYDGFPETPGAELIRQHRWIRGDWQLLPVLFSRMKLAAADRMKLLGNLLRSLYAPALLGLIIHSAWLDRPGAFSLALVLAFHEALLHPVRGGRKPWKRALVKLAMLPAEAGNAVDAILRTLWRLSFTRRHLMDWVPAADAVGGEKHARVSGRIAALLMLPALLRPFWAPAVLAMAALFLVGMPWAEDLSRISTDERRELSGVQKDFLRNLARRTWHFFEDCVPEDGCGLPPDNVQYDPPAGVAMRTSPTNIGLYLVSCVAARELGFIDEDAMLRRMHSTAAALESMEKWNGQLYNWYDLHDLQPLRPRYVSAVDSGNLAASLLLCASAAGSADDALAGRMQALAEGMDLAALYDRNRDLFRIGMDAEGGRLSQSHYDLYASEARILSYTAVMLGQVPVRHWHRLNRSAVRAGKEQALISWSGTMFEYLMPEIFMRSKAETLAGRSRRGVVACQMNYGRALNRPWGISESGYYAFDLQLNYQYRAFGLRDLALSESAVQDVVAPYACALALAENPAAAADNLRRMCEMGWSGENGMFEAADYIHLDAGRRPRLVRSGMAHHQGMALCAMCNALCGDVLSRRFMEIPQARALSLLLEEKPGARIRLHCRPETGQIRRLPERTVGEYARTAHPEGCAADVHLLHGAGTSALVTARGAAFVRKGSLQINRFSGDLQTAHEGMYVHLKDERSGKTCVLGSGGRMVYDAGSVRCSGEFEGLTTEMKLFISPEDGTFYQQLEIENPGGEERILEATGCFAAALAHERDMRAHAVFQNLFVESRRDGDAIVLRRRVRGKEEEIPELVYRAAGGEVVSWETSLEKLVGRSGSLGTAGGIAQNLSNTTGYVLNPCAALRVRIRVACGSTAKLHFALALSPADQRDKTIERMGKQEAARRAGQLAYNHALAVLSHSGIDEQRFRLLQRASALVFDAKLRPWIAENAQPCTPAPRSNLWSVGISGDLPVLLAECGSPEGLECARNAVRMHAFYQEMGVQLDLVLISDEGGDYRRDMQDALHSLAASSHLGGSIGVPGGVYLLDKRIVPEAAYNAVRRAAALRFEDGRDIDTQLRAMLNTLALGEHIPYRPMDGESVCFPENTEFFNGCGGFDGDGYAIFLRNGILPPAPWSNVLATDTAGAIVTERGGGFAWFANSRSGRLTSFANDVLREGWGWMFYLLDDGRRRWIRLLPGDEPMTQFCVRHAPGVSRWNGRADGISFALEMQALEQGIRFDITLMNEGEGMRHLRLAGFVDWLMGCDGADLSLLRTWSNSSGCFASGAAEWVGCFLADDPRARPGCSRQCLFSGGDMMQPRGLDMLDRPGSGWTMQLPLSLRSGETRRCRFLLGCAEDISSAVRLARDFRSGEALRRSRENWQERMDHLRIRTPDPAVNAMIGGFLQAQVLNGRIRARTGLYQPGGAYGFRDQLQDMLPMIHYEPERVRRHLLYCAARQFEAGDVLHWWHDPYSGVRTRISDDMLFLPYIAAQYVHITGDEGVLEETVSFLQDVEIPEGREDIYASMQPSAYQKTLHEHCMRAFRRAAERTGEHGLCLMGSGDWNDGMNRVGMEGRGESIWLSQFLAVCAEDYARIAPDAQDRTWLEGLSGRMRAAVEAHGWDGAWYLRAYGDDGNKLGSRDNTCCRIDAISQAWAVLAGLDADRCKSAMDAAWELLADEEAGLIRLLDPPFDGRGMDPGYIAAYPPGIRENGAQYTHAACWLLMALIRRGDAQRAHRALKMLLPVNHASDRRKMEAYRVEPYVMAADVYARGEHAGRGGWTWYTGSAAWMLTVLLELLGYERRGSKVRLHAALLGEWKEVSVSVQYGLSNYRLVCRADAGQVELDGRKVAGDFIELSDDGRMHTAVFPPG